MLPHVIEESKRHTSNISQELRRRRVIAFKNAWNRVDETTLRRSFKGAGIFPLDESALMQKHLISDPSAEPLQVRNSPISGTVATENLEYIPPLPWRIMEHNRFINKFLEPSEITPEIISLYWFTVENKNGRMFSRIPSITVDGMNLLHNFTR